jgi:integrase
MAKIGKKDPKRKKPFSVYWEEYGLDGKRISQRRNFFASRKEADEFAALKNLERRHHREPGRHSFGKAVDLWLEATKDRLSPNTWHGYADKIGKAVRFIGSMPLERVDRNVLGQLYKTLLREGGVTQRRDKAGRRMSRGLSSQSVQHVHRACSTFFRFCVREKGWIRENPCEFVSPPRVVKSRRTRSLRRDEILTLIDVAANVDFSPGFGLLVRVLLEAGLRRSEVLALGLDAIVMDDQGRPAVSVFRKVTLGHDRKPILSEATKSHHSNRTIPISAELATLLAAQAKTVREMALAAGSDYLREPVMLLFPDNPFGDLTIPDTLTSRLRLLLRKAGIKDAPMGTHVLRHSMGSHMLRGQTDIATISRRLGHSKVSTTLDIYLHSDEDAAREAAEVAAAMFKK